MLSPSDLKALPLLVPKLKLGNPGAEAPASREALLC